MHVSTGVFPGIEVQAARQLELIRDRPPAEERPFLDHLEGAGVDDLPAGEVPPFRVGEAIPHGGVLERAPGQRRSGEQAERAVQDQAPEALIRREPESHQPRDRAEHSAAGARLDEGEAEYCRDGPHQKPEARQPGVLRRPQLHRPRSTT